MQQGRWEDLGARAVGDCVWVKATHSRRVWPWKCGGEFVWAVPRTETKCQKMSDSFERSLALYAAEAAVGFGRSSASRSGIVCSLPSTVCTPSVSFSFLLSQLLCGCEKKLLPAVRKTCETNILDLLQICCFPFPVTISISFPSWHWWRWGWGPCSQALGHKLKHRWRHSPTAWAIKGAINLFIRAACFQSLWRRQRGIKGFLPAVGNVVMRQLPATYHSRGFESHCRR